MQLINPFPRAHPRKTNGRAGRSAFSFVEILFAIFILGIGFIMIAAIFPVAIQQSQATSAETFARSLGISGVGYLRAALPLQSTPTTQAAPSNGFGSKPPYPVTTSQLPCIQGNMISPVDPTFAWFPYYTSDASGNVNRLIVVVMQNSNGKAFTAADLNTMPPVSFREEQGVLTLWGSFDSSGNQTLGAPSNVFLFYDTY